MSGLLRRRRLLHSTPSLRNRYDVVIIGGGAHGLAIAYYLAARHGVRDVAVLERSYIGSGGSGRNTTVLRANYKTPEAIAFYQSSFDLYKNLTSELDYNLLRSQRGLIWLAHGDSSRRTQRERALLNQTFGVETVFLEPDEVKKLCPQLDLACGKSGRPVVGASYHPPGSVIRHDAVVWGYAANAQRLGVEIHQGTDVTGITVRNGRCEGLVTSRGKVAAGTVVCAAGGYVSDIARFARLELPLTTHPLQAFVTEPCKPVLDRIVLSTEFLTYVSQTSRGEMLVGAEIEPYSSYSTRSTFSFLSDTAARCIDQFPFMAKLQVLRQWTGVCEMSPDYSPIMGPSGIGGFYLNTGWGTWGFKAVPAAGIAIAELVATEAMPELIAPFALSRFHDDQVIADRASAGTH